MPPFFIFFRRLGWSDNNDPTQQLRSARLDTPAHTAAGGPCGRPLCAAPVRTYCGSPPYGSATFPPTQIKAMSKSYVKPFLKKGSFKTK